MPPKKRARKSKAVTPPEEQAETFTQANEVFSEDEEGDDESEEEMQQYEESESESEELDGATGEGPAGTISRMVVKNFMNHEHLKMDLKPGINFIIGKNGSGKSAMCHAAQVALGASARDTERGSSMAGFVRHGQPSCEVRLEIRNAPRDDAFEYGAYGDTIVVERTVNASGGGSYRLRAADNSVVSRKRDDLQRMLDHYNIQVNNPCSVLGQDDSKKLATGSDDYKYQFYLRASGLQTVLDQLKAAREAMKQIDEILERQGKEVPRLEQEMAGFQKEHDDASELFALQDQLDRYTHELAWSQVGDKRLEIQETQQKIDEQQSEMDKQSQTVEKLREEIAELKPKFQEGEKQMAEFNKKLSENQQKTQELKRAEDKAKKEAKRKQKEVEMKKKRISDGKTEIAGNEDEIQRIKEAPLENASAKKMQAVREKLNAKQTEVQGMHRDYKKLNDEMDQVEEDLEKLGNDEKQHKRNLDELTKGQRQAKQNLDYYKNNTGNADARFGDDLNKLMAAIDQNERKFSVKPIGPVGKYISMKDERWSDAVESAIGIGPLCTVLVQTYQDEQLCLQLAKQLRLNLRKVRFYRTKIDGGSYRDTGQLKMERFPARDKGFVSVLDVIEVTNTAVENFLYDRQMYSALLFPDREDCIKIAYKSNERNVGSCYDMEATRYYTTGGSQHQIPYRRDQREPNLMVSDNTQAIAQAERDFHEAKDKVVAEKQRFALVAKHYQREGQTPKDRAKFLQKHLAFNQKKQGQLGRNIRDLEDEMADFANEDDEEVARGNEVDGLLQASQVLEQENENLQSQMEESQREYEQLQQEAQEAERKKEEFLSQQEGSFEDMQLAVAEEMDKTATLIDKKTGKAKTAEKKLTEARVKLADFQKERKVKEKEEVDAVKTARLICEKDEEVTTEMSTATLNNRRASIVKRLEREAQKAGGRTLEAINDDLDRSQRAVDNATKSMKYVKKTQNTVSSGFVARKKKYMHFRKTTAINARKMFNKHLSKKGHHGDLKFAHKNRTLGIKVTLMSDGGTGREVTNTKTLSGGEKSFTTLALLLALGSVTQVPFAIFDEIDVFMDDVNRKITLQALYDEAKMQAGRRQYCVLTPHDLTGIKTDEDTQILKMKEPERLGS